ncbi:beta-ketoacyl synthase N-terminal-like domain-containing protein [Bacillus velezensis]
MKEFLHRVFSDVKNKKMTKQDAIGILRDYDMRMELRQAASLHPLAQQHISDETGQGFSAAFSGREFFLADVSLQRKKLMPGELLLEMARAAAVLTVKETAAVRLTHIVWSKPILTEAEPFHIEIRLIPAEGEAKRFEIYNPFSADSSHYDVYSQGTIQPVDAAPGMLDISRLMENSGSLMDQQQIEAITQNDTVQYSEHMKGIERIYASAGRMLADISIPLTNQKESARFGLPPCVMQSVTEACALLGGKEYKTLAPVSLDELLFYESCPDKVWAEIQEKAGSFYIDLCDEEGKIWASLSGLKLQPVIKTGAPGKTNAEHRSERLYEQTLFQLKTLFGLTAKIAVSNIDTEEPLETYGINSVTVTKLNRELSLLFGDLSKTVFYEYKTLGSLAAHFVTDYPNECRKWTNDDEHRSGISEQVLANEVFPVLPSFIKRKKRPAFSNENQTKEGIAIIGVSGRYPQAETLEEYWDNLAAGKDCVTEIPEERWEKDKYYNPDPEAAVKAGKSYSKRGGFLKDAAFFDPLFFQISPRDALNMDPQERLFIEMCWQVLEDAGYTKEQLENLYNGRVGVFAGITKNGYGMYWKNGGTLQPKTSFSSAANRVSYFLNLKGPSMPVDTMCSSSLTAIHEACENILRGACDMAIAGGVNVYTHPSAYAELSAYRMLSKDGTCKSFGEGGDGFVPGEGVGAVLLKPLSKAMADKDHIYGVIRGTHINHGGRTNGYTVPSPSAQADVISGALEKSGIHPRMISCIEAHGTGTELGDPIEIDGLTRAFQTKTSDKGFCAISSVKSNIGHLEAAAGIAGVTKLLLQFQKRKLAPSLHCRNLNPNIAFDRTPFAVQRELADWKRPVIEENGAQKEIPRIAGISSFGAGGANAHILIEEYIEPDREISEPFTDEDPAVILLSAKQEASLKQRAQQLLQAIRKNDVTDRSLRDAAYTLQTGREAMEERAAFIVTSTEQLAEKLQRFIDGGTDGCFRGKSKQYKDILAVFKDEDMQEAVRKWMKRKKFAKLLELWVKGLKIDWSELYNGSLPHRVSLPGYPFIKDRYWPDDAAPDNVRGAETHSETFREFRFLQKSWAESSRVPAKEVRGVIGIAADHQTGNLAVELSRYFPESEIIDAASPEISGDAAQFGGLIDVTGCGTEIKHDDGWIHRLQSLIDNRNRGRKLQLLCVTKGLEPFANETINLSGAKKAGLYRMLQSEYKDIRSRHMDAERTAEDSELANQIAEEFFRDSADIEVCYRNGVRYHARLKETNSLAEKEFSFPKDHALWITGGTRGLGYLFARHFAERYGVTKLVLTGKETMPPKAEWDDHIKRNSPFSDKVRRIRELEQKGVRTEVLSVSSGPEYEQAVSRVKEKMGPIGGVIHAAGAVDLDHPAFIRKTREQMMTVLEPKTDGLDLLYQALHKEPLRFFALFSSVSGVMPELGAGQSDYAMANAYMDYFAAAKGFPVLSIQWPSWKETGMGESKSRAYQKSGLKSITDREGLSLFDAVMAGDCGSVIMPAVIHPEKWEPDRLMLSTGLTETKQHVQGETESVEEWLTGICCRELRLKPSRFESDTPFQDYGADSIMLAQVSRAIGKRIKADLDPAVLYEYPTVAALAGWLETAYPEIKDAVSKPVQPVIPDVPKQTAAAVIQPSGAAAAQDIAVVGMSCRFPGAESIEAYWKLLSEGTSAIKRVPKERWKTEKADYAGLLKNVTHFDPEFFLIPEEDIKAMDIQSFLILEEALHLFRDSGYSLQEMKGRSAGVYLGGRGGSMPDENRLKHAKNPIVAAGPNYLAANLSQFFDLKGPSLVLDTACSSALVGMNMAIQALSCGEIDSAVVGGVSLLESGQTHRMFELRNLLSEEPAFHIFDRRTGGIVLGEGVGMVYLKTAAQAVKDGDRIHAVIKGISVNNDGRTAGPATPNIQAQKEVMAKALAKSGRKAEDISYIEANGSGSEVTDLLELRAIEAVYRMQNSAPCELGSMKPNIGHPLCAEGIAGFIKTVLMLSRRMRVPFLSGKEPMTHYDLSASPFYFSHVLREWTDSPRIAAVSSFADGGTNAHVIVEAWEQEAYTPVRKPLPRQELKRRPIRPDKAENLHENAHESRPNTFWKQMKTY